ncbi:MAG: glutaminyl-peptide cyclotransferase [Thermoguttaceae bacterium]
MKYAKSIWIILFWGLVLFSSFWSQSRAQRPTTSLAPADSQINDGRLTLKTIAVHPHDSAAYTQGLLYENDFLYESTGQYGESTLRKVDVKTGKVVQQFSLPPRFFAEGLASTGNLLYQLTWKEGYCLVYDKESFRLVDQFRYSGEGWGLAFDGESFVFSDGSATIQFRDPKTFKTNRKIRVMDRLSSKQGKPVNNLNELEMVRGEIWANVWQTPFIVRISPETGDVIGWVNCTALVPDEHKRNPDSVLNGIAYHPKTNRLFLTGKNWRSVYEFEIEEEEKNNVVSSDK